MPRPFKQLTLDQFTQLLQQFTFKRQIDSVHMHHTWRPDRSMYRGLATIEAMYQFHTVHNGWSDIAQHISIAPDGSIWTGRNWNDPPASATGYNGNRAHGPFMFEVIADFDKGKDPFDGAQRDTVMAVIALVQQRFGLPLESLRLHNQMTNVKTCPGSGVDRSQVLDAVQKVRQELAEVSATREFRPIGGHVLSLAEPTGVQDLELLAEPDEETSPTQARYFAGDEAYVQLPPGSRGFAAARGFSPQDLDGLRPYVISMRQGQWDRSGIFNSTAGDVDALFFEHAESAINSLAPNKKLKFVVYAHGGLVSEQHGLAQAQTHIDWWKQSANEGIYPLYFVWKTGLAETIGQLLGFGAGGGRDMAVTREAITDPVIAAIARRLGGEAIWSGMKRDAEQAVLPNGAATYVARKMKEFCDRHRDRIELHAVGHSAGSIFHSHYIPMSTVTGNPYFTTTSFMAPAARVDTFLDLLTLKAPGGELTLKPEVGHLTIFTMKKDFEKKDDCAGIYRQSLLYLIYHALERDDPTPLLGLEESIRADSRLTALLGLGGNPPKDGEVVWSPSIAADGRSASRAIHHGDFSSDAASLNSILRRVLNVGDTDPIHEFPSGSRAFGPIWDIWAPPDDLPTFNPPQQGGANKAQAPAPQPSAPQPAPSVAPSENRKAICVGIDNYASPNRLTGCVHDARTWSDVLTARGFRTKLILDMQATYESITSELRTMVSSSLPGDVIVFQYSGHGTTVPDATGRTVDGVEEAMVPVDFSAQNPRLLMDFELASIFNTLPSGVNLTCFIDCCHSGTITRLLIGSAPQSFTGSDERPRFITLTAEEIAAVKQYRSSFAATARGNTLGGPGLMHDIVFSACKPEEVAWEVDGQGEFTRRATTILNNGTQGMTNEQFSLAVTQAFGAQPRQHPMLDCAPPAKTRALLKSEV